MDVDYKRYIILLFCSRVVTNRYLSVKVIFPDGALVMENSKISIYNIIIYPIISFNHYLFLIQFHKENHSNMFFFPTLSHIMSSPLVVTFYLKNTHRHNRLY